MGIAGKNPQSHGQECGLYPGPGILDLSSGQVGIIQPALYFKKIGRGKRRKENWNWIAIRRSLCSQLAAPLPGFTYIHSSPGP